MNHYIKILIFFMVQGTFQLAAQTLSVDKEIIKNYDQLKLKRQKKEFQNSYHKNKQAAYDFAIKHNIDTIIKNKDRTISYLESIDEFNHLFYITTFNTAAAITSNIDALHEGGILGLSLNGSGVNAGVWDDGLPRLSHQDLISRINYMDEALDLPKKHATHVIGTLIGSGVGNESAKGMAYGGSIQAWDFFDDIPEIQSAAGSGMIVSNHSYGTSPSQLDVWHFGAYLNVARSIDLITNLTPFYLPVFAVGNSRNNSPPHNPLKNGFDLITGRQAAKNILTVGNCLTVDEYQGPESVELWTTSSWGPTDDLRIKPDITAKGRQTLSTFHTSDNAYGTITGTSMASPVVAGTIMLLQELHYDLFNQYMMSHEVRALLTGTTMQAGEYGPAPDVKFGFGLLDALSAAEVLLNSGFTSFFNNITLENNQTYTDTFSSIGGETPLEVTIAWNDPAGYPQENGIVDQEDARLINDLDLRIFDEEGNQFFPYYIMPSSQDYATSVGDNSRDNIEKIHISNPSGNYFIQVTHKDSLVNEVQDFAIVATGVNFFPYNITVIDNNKEICPVDEVQFKFDFITLTDFSGEVNFDIIGLPSEINFNLSSTVASIEDTITINLSNLLSLSPGSYDFSVEAKKDDLSLIRNLNLTILEDTSFEDLELIFPPNQSLNIPLNTTFKWTPVYSAQDYLVEIATNQNFENNLISDFFSNNEVFILELSPNTTYYWRVKPLNDCLEGQFAVGSFTTEKITCIDPIFSTYTPITIEENQAGIYQASIFIEESLVDQISKLKVYIDIEHSYVEDLIIKLISPSGTEVVLIDQVCGSGQNINVIFDDSAEIFSCNTDMPTITGSLQPQNPLNAFINDTVEGEWTLFIEDVMEDNGGIVNSFGIEFCDGTALLSLSSLEELPITIYPNPASSSFNIQFDSTITEATIHIYDLNGRLVSQFFHDGMFIVKSLDVSFMSSGLYLVEVISGGLKTVKKLVKL